MMQLLRNYKYEYGSDDTYLWFMPEPSTHIGFCIQWYFSTYSWRVQIEREIDPDITWDSWKITEVLIGYSITNN